MLLSPLRLPFRHGPEGTDSTGDTAILEAVRKTDWERLGALLGVADRELGSVIAAWTRSPPRQRSALSDIVGI